MTRIVDASPFFLSIVIPAYNEEHRIGATLRAVDAYLAKQPYPSEILVVSDGSKDKTAEVVRGYARGIRNLRLIDNRENHGKGWVVRHGMLEARGALRLFTDADNATPIEELERLLPFIKKPIYSPRADFIPSDKFTFIKIEAGGYYDIAIGSIGIPGKSLVKVSEPLPRVIIGKLGNILIQLLATPGIWDTQRGFKLFTKEAAEKIFAKTKINRWGFDFEALALGRRFGFKIKEAPVVWIHKGESKVEPSAFLKVLIELLKVRWWLWFNY